MDFIKKILFLAVVVVIMFGAYQFYMKKQASKAESSQAGAPQAMPAQFAEPVIRDVVLQDEYTGRIESIESVEIRARVKGFLQKIDFKDGAFVEKGDLLFEIEPELYQADRDRAVAELKSAQADLQRAQQDYERVLKAVKGDAVSKQDVSKSLAEREMAESKVIGAKAALAQADLNLSYTKIYSPVDGKISRRFVDVGNLVGATDMTLLARVVALDPIYVYFNVSEGDLLDYYEATSDIVSRQPGSVKFTVSLSGETKKSSEGVLDYMDNTVDAATGTIQIRGILPNPEKTILPGMFARINVPAGEKKNAVLIQEKAIGTDLSGKFVLVIGEGNIVEQRSIVISELVDGLRVVESGLAAGEKYIVTGTQFIQPGMPVMPVPEGQMPPMGGPETGPVPEDQMDDSEEHDEESEGQKQ